MNLLTVSIVFVAIFSNCQGYKILAVFPVPARSHFGLNSKIVKELVNRGHDVTMVTPYPQKSTPRNLKEISVEFVMDVLNEHKIHLVEMENTTIFEHVQFVCYMSYTMTEAILRDENVQKLLKSEEKYDLVLTPMFYTEGLMGIAQHFKAPLVLVATMPLFPWSTFLLGHPITPAYVPHLLTPYNGHMNFWERLSNSFHDFYTVLYHQWVELPRQRELVKKYIPSKPDLYDVLNNVSLLLINSDSSTCEPMPQVPNAIEIGGAHVEEPKPLPGDLQKFMDESKDGVVVLSLGSNLKSTDLPSSKRDDILKSFSKLKQNVLFKWETDSLPGQPKNVKLIKWLPLNDVLAHPNVKAFITHGGLMSIMESIYHGVPTLGIPFFGDQKMNMAKAVSEGYSVHLPFQELNEQTLSSALNEVLNNPKYRENAQKRSKIMKDRPLKPIDTAIYWIEYVVRHQGAPHLRYSGMDLNWYQRNLLDVVAFVFGSIFVSIYVIRLIVKRLFSRKTGASNKKKTN